MNFDDFIKDVEKLLPRIGLFGLRLYNLVIPFCKSMYEEITNLRTKVTSQNNEIEQLKAENKQLQDKLGLNSKNSSKPPSQDSNRVQNTSSQRPKANKKPGGQPGHKGQGGHVTENPDQIVKYEVSSCPACQNNMQDVVVDELLKFQVHEVPAIKAFVVEHQVEVKTCLNCGTQLKAGGCPVDIKHQYQYGPNAKALAVVLSSVHMIPVKRVTDIMSVLGLKKLSVGSVLNFQKAASKELQKEFIPLLKRKIIQSSSAHFDETGVKLSGKSNWVHVASTMFLSLFSISPKRGEEAMTAMGILEFFRGVGHTDCWAAYSKFLEYIKSLCNAHILRELQGAIDRNAANKVWAEKLKQLLLDAKKGVEISETNILNPELQKITKELFLRYVQDGLLLNPAVDRPPTQQKGRVKQSKTHNLLKRLNSEVDSFLRFTTDPNAAFDNNQAERDLRMLKVKMKVSGCFRSFEAAQEFMDVRSFVATARKQGKCPIDMLKSLFTFGDVRYMQLVNTPE
jgi:transposase